MPYQFIGLTLLPENGWSLCTLKHINNVTCSCGLIISASNDHLAIIKNSDLPANKAVKCGYP